MNILLRQEFIRLHSQPLLQRLVRSIALRMNIVSLTWAGRELEGSSSRHRFSSRTFSGSA
jgi:hypothetical protein